jgi:iron complex transport system substrate-binding protein
MEELGLPVVVLDAPDIEGVFANIELVGQVTGAEEEAEKLVAKLRVRRDNLLAKVENVSHKPRVFLEISSLLYTVGPDTFMGAFIDLAGGVNIAADSGTSWPQFSAEEIIARDPEVIILADTDLEVTAEMVKARPGWEDITALKNDAVYNIDADIIARPGPRMIDGLEALTKVIHPELFD